MVSDPLPWLTAAVSLAGVVLNVQRRASSFICFGVANASWACIDLYHGIVPQALLQTVYLGLSVWGWLKWSRKDAAHA